MRTTTFSAFFLASLCVTAACVVEEQRPPSDDDDGGKTTATNATTGTGGAVGCQVHAECSGETPYCDAGACIAAPPGSELGWDASVKVTTVLQDASLKTPTDLGFNPSDTKVLWVINRKDDSAVIITNPGEATQSFIRKRDPAASHFMETPPAFDFGVMNAQWGQTFGVCGDGDNGGNDFMGPALFTANLDVFATNNAETGLGSHLDMLHSTSYCRGIAHVEANVYFAFNGDKGSIDRYDFQTDHGPGFDDHSDGRILRYVNGQVAGVTGLASHVAYDADSKLLYIADSGHGRIAALDTTSGTEGANFGGSEFIDQRKMMDGAVLTEVVPPGTLTAPSGIEFHRGLIFVSDNATSTFYAYKPTGELVTQLGVALPPGSLGGFTFGPDGKLWFVDLVGGQVLRIDPQG